MTRNAPARIWATVNGQRSVFPGASYYLIGGWGDRPSERGTEYVRADVSGELLDALQHLLEVHDALGAGQSHAAKKARAAIEKAKGGGN